MFTIKNGINYRLAAKITKETKLAKIISISIYSQKHNTKNSLVPVLHDSLAQVKLAVWKSFSITLKVSVENDGDAITELALKGTAPLPKKRKQ